jgi:hypothetical protein
MQDNVMTLIKMCTASHLNFFRKRKNNDRQSSVKSLRIQAELISITIRGAP